MSEMEQIVARAIRFCSHADVPDKYVDVYYHASALKSYPNKDPKISQFAANSSLSWLTINQQMYLTAIKKQTLNIQFEQAMKEAAIDCNLNKFGNIVRLERVTMKGPLSVENIYYDRTTNSYYSVEQTERVTIRGIDLNYSDKLWPATAYVYNYNTPQQATLGSADGSSLPTVRRRSLGDKSLYETDLSIIIPENIKCSTQKTKKTFGELFNHAILNGEEPSAWKYCYDSYKKNAILPQLTLKYNLYEWGIGGEFMECLYNKLLNPKKYNLSTKEVKKLENFIIRKDARLNNTQRYKEILAKKLDKKTIDSLNYPQLETLAKKIGFVARKKSNK
jgi:hypothetical protein